MNYTNITTCKGICQQKKQDKQGKTCRGRKKNHKWLNLLRIQE